MLITDINDLNSAENAVHAFNELQTSTFLTDQVVFLREACHVGIGVITDAALCEIAYLRLFAYKARLANGAIDRNAYFVRYNNVKVSDPAGQNTLSAWLYGHANRDGYRTMIRDYSNAHTDYIKRLAISFSNIVCTIAFVFRQKGHHYIIGPDYQEAYTRIWAKAARGMAPFIASWEQISTTALHCIIPIVVDQYWRFAAM